MENTGNPLGAFAKAMAFAADKHRNQRRKDAEASPYINHPIALANMLANEGGVDDVTVLCAAVLHDTIEDTETTADELRALFGPKVASVVMEVTDDKSLEKSVRKQRQVEHARHISTEANLVKLADKISNLRDILASPPADWSAERKQTYFDWARTIVAGLRGVHPSLEAVFDGLRWAGCTPCRTALTAAASRCCHRAADCAAPPSRSLFGVSVSAPRTRIFISRSGGISRGLNMHIDEFRTFQREGATHNVFSFAMTCRRKFLNAAHLLELRGHAIDKLASFGVDAPVDVWPLLGPFSVLTERYATQLFSPQENLFLEPSEKQDEKWGSYFHHVLVPQLIASDEVVRNVLRAVRALPSRQPEQAAVALSQHFAEMTLPKTRPPWGPEDAVDY